MIRAGVFIGVDRTGDMPLLSDAAAGAARMRAWAVEQGMPKKYAVLLTDAGGKPVTPARIRKAVQAILDGPGVEQLIVYFAGHGVINNRNEHWLLSESPDDTSAAVDERSSADLALYCGVQHVVFISDACRVAPQSLRVANVRGQDIFPNVSTASPAREVDRFFACLPGRTAAEVRDAGTAETYSALYTDALLDGLSGGHVELLEPAMALDDTDLYVNPPGLKAYLAREVPRRVLARGLVQQVNQQPDALLSRAGLWLARFPRAAALPMDPPFRGPGGEFEGLQTSADPVREITRVAVAGDRAGLVATVERLQTGPEGRGADVARTVTTVAAPFGPDHFETECGIKVRGARVTGAWTRNAEAEQVTDELIRVTPVGDRAVSVVVQLDDGSGTVVPALPGFLAGLTCTEGELVDVAYEPSVQSWRWGMFQHRADELRALRAVAATASLHGRFELVGAEAPGIARAMQLGKGIDPTLAVYAAYAYHDLQEFDRIRDMASYLGGDIGVSFFDVELLARKLVDRRVDATLPLVPFVPLLAQGWALLRANRVTLHDLLSGLGETLLESVWSLYSPDGVEMLKQALATGAVR